MDIKRQANNFASIFAEEAMETSRDMMLDEPQEYTTFSSVEKVMSYSVESFVDGCLEEYLEEFCKEVRERLKQTKIITKEVKFDREGVVDVCAYQSVE